LDEGTNNFLESIQRQAAAVEELLYRKHLKQPHLYDDDPFVVCNDSNDIDRINEILSRQLAVVQGDFAQRCKKRRETHLCKSQIQDSDLRELTLQQCLGVDGYRRANIVLKAIDQIGVELTGDCFTRCDSRMRLAKGSMPEPVRQLFCQTSLRTQMYFTPVSQLHTIAWDESLQKAERRLYEFKVWSNECKEKANIVTESKTFEVLNKADSTKRCAE
jgi:hypothetical protein